MNEKLSTAYDLFDKWCEHHGAVYDIIVDEDDLQAYLLPKKYASLAPRLHNFLQKIALQENLHCSEKSTRSGIVYAISLMAISEAAIDALVPHADRGRLARRIDLAFGDIAEAQYHSPSTAVARQYKRPTQAVGGNRKGGAIAFKPRLESRLRDECYVNYGQSPAWASVGTVVREALDGIAADYQPGDVLEQFESALRELGMLDALGRAGVSNKLSKDRQIIYFYINDENGRPRAIASYELTKLAEPKDMEQAIKDLIDISQRNAPGTTDRRLETIKGQEQAIRDVAQNYSPAAAEKAAAEMSGRQNGAMRPRMGMSAEHLQRGRHIDWDGPLDEDFGAIKRGLAAGAVAAGTFLSGGAASAQQYSPSSHQSPYTSQKPKSELSRLQYDEHDFTIKVKWESSRDNDFIVGPVISQVVKELKKMKMDPDRIAEITYTNKNGADVVIFANGRWLRQRIPGMMTLARGGWIQPTLTVHTTRDQ